VAVLEIAASMVFVGRGVLLGGRVRVGMGVSVGVLDGVSAIMVAVALAMATSVLFRLADACASAVLVAFTSGRIPNALPIIERTMQKMQMPIHPPPINKSRLMVFPHRD
jgi:hypothetical protein